MSALLTRLTVLILATSTVAAHAWVSTERYPGHETPGAAFICAGADVALLGFLSALTNHYFFSKPGSPIQKHALRIRNVSGAVAVIGAVGAVAAYAAAAYKYGGNFDSGRCYLTKLRIHSTRQTRVTEQASILERDQNPFDYTRP